MHLVLAETIDEVLSAAFAPASEEQQTEVIAEAA